MISRKSVFEIDLKKQTFQGAQPRQRRDVVLTVPVEGGVLGEGSPSLRKQADFLTLKNLPSPKLTGRGDSSQKLISAASLKKAVCNVILISESMKLNMSRNSKTFSAILHFLRGRVKAALCVCIAASACIAAAHAEQIAFNISALNSTYKEPVPVEAEWNERWFGESPATTYHHGIARIAMLFSEICYTYNEDITNPDNTLLQAYRQLGFQDKDIELHYDIDFTDQELGKDQCMFSLAHRSIASALGKKELIFLIIRGTSDISDEWISNLNLSDDTGKATVLHEGFRKAADQVYLQLASYIERSGIDAKDAFLVVTGHSRGASIANVLGSYLAAGSLFTPERCYVYTFASPNVTTDEAAQDDRYGFIWNIVNGEDLVPTVPIFRGKWKYRKFGRTLTLVNYWNSDREVFANDFMPRLNEMHRKINGNVYTPFKTGPFIPIQVTTLFSALNGDVEKFYAGPLSLRGKGESLLNIIFPSAGKVQQSAQEKNNAKAEAFASWLNKVTGGKIEFAATMFTDMHSAESYLSFLLALSEDEVFSTLGCSQIIMRGCCDGAVVDAGGNPLLRFVNGKVIYSSIKLPVIAWDAPGNNIIIGVPGNMDVDIVLANQSLLPTSIPLTVEYFDSAGVLERTFNQQHLSPHRGLAYRFSAGASTLSDHKILAEELHWGEASQALAQSGVKPGHTLLISPEINLSTDFNIGYGIHVGTPTLYASVMGGTNVFQLLNSFEIAPGIGTQQTLIGPIVIDIEAYLKCIGITEELLKMPHFTLVPSGRVSLSYKPFKKANIFVAGVFDFMIDGFNEEAFTSFVRMKNFQLLAVTDTVSVLPTLQFGIRF